MPICPVKESCKIYPLFKEKITILREHLKKNKKALKGQRQAKFILLQQCLETYQILEKCDCCECDINCRPCYDHQHMNYVKQTLELMTALTEDNSIKEHLHQQRRHLEQQLRKRAIISPPIKDATLSA